MNVKTFKGFFFAFWRKTRHGLWRKAVGLVDSTGSLVVEYNYDAWGRIIGRTGSLVGTLGWLNPFRYRGYVYDEETRMYYLKSRYYNPEWGRFINADEILGQTGEVLSHNLFAYCRNCPIIHFDPKGYSAISASFPFLADINKPVEIDITDRLNEAMEEHYKELTAYSFRHTSFETLLFF